jgi:hypothetical protein
MNTEFPGLGTVGESIIDTVFAKCYKSPKAKVIGIDCQALGENFLMIVGCRD